MTNPVPDADALEQRRTAGDPEEADLPRDLPDAAPEADALEQAAPAGPAGGRTRSDLPLEASDADADEQSLAVPFDDDEARE